MLYDEAQERNYILHLIISSFISFGSGLPPRRVVQPDTSLLGGPEDDRCSLLTYQGQDQTVNRLNLCRGEIFEAKFLPSTNDATLGIQVL